MTESDMLLHMPMWRYPCNNAYRKHYHPGPRIPFDEYYMAFRGRLSKADRWVKLADMIPWDEVEQRYARKVTSAVEKTRISVRVVFGL